MHDWREGRGTHLFKSHPDIGVARRAHWVDVVTDRALEEVWTLWDDRDCGADCEEGPVRRGELPAEIKILTVVEPDLRNVDAVDVNGSGRWFEDTEKG